MQKGSRSIIKILLLGLLVRFLIAPFTMNWDFLTNTKDVNMMFSGSLKDVYMSPLASYPLMTFVTRFIFLCAALPLIPDFSTWINSGDLALLSDPSIFRILFLLKLPVIFLDIFAGLIFSTIYPKERKRILMFWMLSPFAIYAIPAFTNVDAFPVFFLVLSLFLYMRGKSFFSSFALGIAASYKLFPVFALPFLLVSQKNFKKAIIVFGIFFIPFILSQIPVINDPQYWQNVYFSGNSRKITSTVFNIGLDRNLIIFVVLYLFIFLKFNSENDKKRTFIGYVFISYVPIFIFTVFHVQWIYWILPFLIYRLVYSKNILPDIILLFSFFGIVFTSQAALHIGMLAPIEPSLWFIDNPLRIALGKESFFITDLFQSVFASTLAWISYDFLFLRKGSNAKT